MAVQAGAEHIQSPLLPWPTYPEHIVIQTLLDQSNEFRAFYQSERGKIVGVVHWAEDSWLPAGIDYRRTLISSRIYGTTAQVVRLRRIPPACDEAMAIAHELCHLLLDAEGYPTVGAHPQFEILSAALASMIHDPVVNLRLRSYGFDLQRNYNDEVRESIRQLSTMPQAPARRVDRLHWIFNYTGKLLDWDLLNAFSDEETHAFHAWFAGRYPSIADEAQKLLALIRSIGYYLPAQQLLLFKEIIQHYQLESIMSLICDPELMANCELRSVVS